MPDHLLSICNVIGGKKLKVLDEGLVANGHRMILGNVLHLFNLFDNVHYRLMLVINI